MYLYACMCIYVYIYICLCVCVRCLASAGIAKRNLVVTMASKCVGGHREAKSGFDRTILKPWAVNHCSKRSGCVCVCVCAQFHYFSFVFKRNGIHGPCPH